uniref:CCHC-type domain-containing protein n=1 Tax=Pogona vitticeps TaxID=103695 RepID=A0ABM5EWB8_9SAUR
MPLTCSQMAEVSEQRDQAMSDWSGDESNGEGRVASVQEEANGEQLSELRKIQLAQAHEVQMRQLEIERERIALEKEERERERQRQFELEKMEREAERERIALEKEKMAFEIRRMEILNQNNNNNRDSGTEPSQLSKSDLKKFPTYKQGDCPENFLKIFERSCADFSVRETEKMIILRSLLSGKMADVYADMPVELSKDYSEFKKMVYNRFGINSEHLRMKFRKLSKKADESYTQLGFNLEKCLDRWLEQENVKTFQELKNVVGLEQFYSLLHGELKFLVQERKPTDVRNAAQIADFISQIRGPSCYEGSGVRKTWDPKFSKEQAQRQTKVGGHFSEKPSEQGQHSKQVLEGKEKLERFDGKSSWGERICFICKKKGHIAAQCFNTRQNKEIPPEKVNVKEAKAVFCVQSKPQASSSESSVTMETQAEAVRSSELDTLKELPLAEVVHCYYIQTNCALLECAGDRIKVFENDYTALRDTCSQISICHSDIVPQSCMIADQTLSAKGIGSELVSLPVADLKIEYQGWKGLWRVGVSSEIPTPFLIGNDLTKHVKSALVVTRSQSVQSEASNETDSQEPEKFQFYPSLIIVDLSN